MLSCCFFLICCIREEPLVVLAEREVVGRPGPSTHRLKQKREEVWGPSHPGVPWLEFVFPLFVNDAVMSVLGPALCSLDDKWGEWGAFLSSWSLSFFSRCSLRLLRGGPVQLCVPEDGFLEAEAVAHIWLKRRLICFSNSEFMMARNVRRARQSAGPIAMHLRDSHREKHCFGVHHTSQKLSVS